MGARDAIAKLLTGIKAYHSSPHDFDRFDLSKIGTGEGAQVYGHGLYFAENPKVSGQGGEYWQQFMRRFEGPERGAAARLQDAGFDRAAAVAATQRDIDQIKAALASGEFPETAKYGTTRSYYEGLLRNREAHQQLLSGSAPIGPRTYEVNIKADPARMLDWDKSMSAQPEVMNRIRPLFSDYRLAPSNYLGESVHKEIRDFHMGHGMSKPAAAEATAIDLRSTGVPGIKYLDEGSRSRAYDIANAEAAVQKNADRLDEGSWRQNLDTLKKTPLTSNYVVFDPGIVDIMKKYGVVAAPAGAVAAMGSTFEEPDPLAGTFR